MGATLIRDGSGKLTNRPAGHRRSFPVLPLLFTRGPSEMARFRGWYRRILWADALTIGGGRHALRSFAKTPARRAREAVEAVRRYGHIGEANGVSRPRQTLRLWWLGLLHGTTPDTFYTHRLFKRSKGRRASRIVQHEEAARIYRMISAGAYRDTSDMLSDKLAFAAWCRSHDIPTVSILRTYVNGAEVPALAPMPLPQADLFSKAARGYGGKAAVRWRWCGDGRWAGGGSILDEGELSERLAHLSKEAPVLLQPAVSNHADLAPLTGQALSTLRIMTTQMPGGVPEVLLAMLRVGGATADMDNFTQGGMVCGIDLTTRRLTSGVRATDGYRVVSFHDAHPDTGVRVDAITIPFLDEALELAVRTHRALGDYPCVGWDIAVLGDGPVVLEGNWNGGVIIAQLPFDTPLGATSFVRSLNAHLALHLKDVDWADIRRLSCWEPHGGTNPWMAI